MSTARRMSAALPVITRAEVSIHCEPESAWIIVNNFVYDISAMIMGDSHPGGMEILLEQMGSDATSAFESVGHSKGARIFLKKFLIGELPYAERNDSVNEYITHAKMHSPLALVV